jgi:hypothetical protein
MANNKQRYINTRFWNDTYISDLDPIEKLLFIYFLTNEHTNISGIYEMPLKIMSVETGIEISMIKKIISRLKERVRYIEGMVVIKNFIKHQETGSPNVRTGILNCLKELDINFVKNVVKQGYFELPIYYMDTLSIPYIEGRNYLDSNLDLDSNNATEVAVGTLKVKRQPKPIVWSEYLKSMDDNPQEHIQLIAHYFRKRKVKFDTDFEVQEAISRHARASLKVIKFGNEKVFKAIDQCVLMENKGIQWTLETVYKQLTK